MKEDTDAGAKDLENITRQKGVNILCATINIEKNEYCFAHESEIFFHLK